MEKRIIEIIEEITEYKELKNQRQIDLLENNILDSLGFIELINALENEFNIEIQPTQIDPNTWRSVDRIIELVKKIKKMNQFTKNII